MIGSLQIGVGKGMKVKKQTSVIHYQLIAFCLLIFGCETVREFIETTAESEMLTEEEIISGLKQALEFGGEEAADQASETGGFYEDSRLYIPFPEEVERVENTLRDIGLGSMVDDFILRLNRSAEIAAAEAGPILFDAIRNITIHDGLEILHGEKNAATTYLYRQTFDNLTSVFQPIISEALDETNTTRYWEDIISRYNQIPFVETVETDLARYTTNRAIDGLFVLVEEEEREIRNDPAARVTDLLRRVFREQDD